MLSQLATKEKVVGAKQTRRAILAGKATGVYIALDADPALTDGIRSLCEEQALPCTQVPTMVELGRACGIAVGTSVACTTT